MNGSTSSDDLGIIRYEWQRDASSLAVGTIVGNTDHEPVLIVSEIESGISFGPTGSDNNNFSVPFDS